MFIFIAGVILGAVPQYLKLILLADAEGSMSSLALMNVSNLTATLNIFILHFEQIKQCVGAPPGSRRITAKPRSSPSTTP